MRTMTPAAETASIAESVEACHLIEFDFLSAPDYVTDAAHNVTWNGKEYKGFGALLNIEGIKETTTGEIVAVRFSLTGALGEYVSLALQENTQNRACRIYYAFWNNGQIVLDPVLEFVGRLNAPSVSDTPSDDGNIQSTVSITAESKFAGSRRPKTLRHSLLDHVIAHPTDTIHRFMPKLQDAQIVWPAASFFKR